LTGTIDVLTGFVAEQGQAHGRHVGVDAALSSSRKTSANAVWRVSATNVRQASR